MKIRHPLYIITQEMKEMLSLNPKKHLVYSAILLCNLTISTPCRADFDFDFDDFLNNEATEDFIRANPPTPPNLCDPKFIASTLVDVGIVPILEQNLYLRTNELNNRSLLDYPIFLPRRWKEQPTTIGFDFFWNKTDRMFFTGSSSALSSYLNIGQSALLDAVTAAFEKAAPLSPIIADAPQPATLLPLFRNFTVEQRRTGVMFHAEKRFKKLFLYCFVPLYYIERNMFASEVEQEALEVVFGRMDQASENELAENHLISDKFGLGDTRMSIDFQLKENDFFGFNLGFFTTIPTAFAFTNGINGSNFKKVTCPPSIDILKLACDALQGTPEEKAAALVSARNFGFQALDNLGAQILESPLGNGGHLGLGFALQTDSYLKNFVHRPWAQAISFRSRLSLEYLVPARKTRYFLENPCVRLEKFAALGLDRSSEVITKEVEDSEAYALELLNFFDEQIVQEFFPTALTARVHPGFIFRSTSKAYHEGEHWYFAIGSDFWLQSKEKLTNLELPGDCNKLCSIKEENFDLKNAHKPVAYQGKIWGTVAYKVIRDDIDWILSLNADQTYLNSGIGSDYTVSLGIEAHF